MQLFRTHWASIFVFIVCLLLSPQSPNNDKLHQVQELDHHIVRPELIPTWLSSHITKCPLFCSPHQIESWFAQVLKSLAHMVFFGEKFSGTSQVILKSILQLLQNSEDQFSRWHNWMKWLLIGKFIIPPLSIQGPVFSGRDFLLSLLQANLASFLFKVTFLGEKM